MSDEPWNQILWSEAHQKMMYREWAIFFARKHLLNEAIQYYNKSLAIQSSSREDGKALYLRSLCYTDLVQSAEGIRDAKTALALEPLNAPVNLQLSDALYNADQFEYCKLELHKNSNKFSGKKLLPFDYRIDVLDQNYKDNLGDTLTPFIRENIKAFIKSHEIYLKSFEIDDTPLWELLRAQGKCDVVSEFEIEKLLTHPREIQRRKLCYKRFNQVYFEKSWVDVLFLSDLRKNDILLLPQTKKSTECFNEWTNSDFKMVSKFLKMLHARSPLYTQKYQRCPNQLLAAKERENHLYRVQYQTRRDMFNMLRRMKLLRAKGKTKLLTDTIEDVMSNYVSLKIHRVMPWKFSFVNEVYNLLALALCDEYKIPPKITYITKPFNRILRLLRVVNRDKDVVGEFIFGDKSTYQEPDAPDYAYIAYKARTNHLESRLYFANFKIEKCYIYYEIARSHLGQSKYDECISVAKKTMEEAALCNSYAWMLLGALLISKTNTAQRKLEKIRDSLVRALEVAMDFKNQEIINLIELCQAYTNEALIGKARSDGSIVKKSKGSVGSSHQSEYR